MKITDKKNSFYHNGKSTSRSSFYLLLLLVPLFIQSCSTEELLENQIGGSIDRNQQQFSGPSYPNPSPDKSLTSFNLKALASGGVMPSKHKGSGTFNAPGPGSVGNLYAGNSHGPSAFYNSSKNYDEGTATTYKDEASSGFMNHLRWMGGIEFVQKKSEDGNTKITLNYLEVPLYLLYQSTLSSTANIFGGLGPYFAYGIGGNMKTSAYKSKAFDKTTGFKPFDAGLGLTAGYKITNSFSFSLAYDIGLVNIDRNAFGDKIKNRGISFNVMYPLNKLIKK